MPHLPPPSRRAAARVVTALLAIAAAGAVLELGALAYLALVEDRFLFVPRQAVWMVPLVHGVVLLAAGLVITAGSRVVPVLRGPRPAMLIGGAYAVLNAALVFHPRLHVVAALVLAIGAGSALARFTAAAPDRALPAIRRAGAASAVALVVAVVAVMAQGRSTGATATGGGRAPTDRPNILLVFLDTVRGDYLSALGHRYPTTPYLDSIARQGILFERAIAPAPWTLPSHASALTGRWPHELGADWTTPLDDGDAPTLAERLSIAGYETVGLVANTRFTSYESGLDRGFARYDDYQSTVGQAVLATALGRFVTSHRRLWGLVGNEWSLSRRSATDVRIALHRWLDRRDRSRPFFAFVNLFDAHHPYEPPPPYRGRFGGPTAPRSLASGLRSLVRPEPVFPRDSAGLRAMRRSYRESLAYIDDEMARIVERLRSSGELANTVIVITSDHGEHFGEHGLVDHGNSLYYSLLHVPLIVVHDGQLPRGRRIDTPVSLRDLSATILDLTGVRDRSIPGHSLRPTWEPARVRPAISPALSFVTGIRGKPRLEPISRGSMAAVLLDSLLVIRSGDCRYEIYDVIADPLNRSDLASRDRGLRDRYAPVLDSLVPATALEGAECGGPPTSRRAAGPTRPTGLDPSSATSSDAPTSTAATPLLQDS